ncbi:MAG: peptidoglycan DD-metalloendopeptidase family protein [Gammaproteobacteria bacterium]|nr:MAG: peptidoglycan DD-metalloendopeptidase family protein [Gammaproteobacteria bacterium]
MFNPTRKIITVFLLLFLLFFSLLFLVSCVSNRNSDVYYDYDHGYHTVLKGETLYSIAFRHGVDYKKIARWNGIRKPYTIYAGQRLKLSPSQATSKTYQAKSKTSSTKRTSTSKKSTTKNTVTKPASKPIKHDWNWPTKGAVIRTYSSRSGGNKGIDIGGKIGQPVLAASSGKVVYSGNGLASYGNLIIIKHSEQFISAYAHNKKLFVKEGGEVKRGQKIAELGNTGTSEAKLHFEIRYKGKPVDPIKYLPKN